MNVFWLVATCLQNLSVGVQCVRTWVSVIQRSGALKYGDMHKWSSVSRGIPTTLLSFSRQGAPTIYYILSQ